MSNAKIKVTYQRGAQLSFQCGDEIFIAEFNTGSYIFDVPRLGTWTIKVENDMEQKLHIVEITDNNQQEEINIKLPITVYENGQFFNGFEIKEQNGNFVADKGNFGLIESNNWLGINNHNVYIDFGGEYFKHYETIKIYLKVYWRGEEDCINLPSLIMSNNSEIVAKSILSDFKQEELNLSINYNNLSSLTFISSNCIGIITKIQVI